MGIKKKLTGKDMEKLMRKVLEYLKIDEECEFCEFKVNENIERWNWANKKLNE